MSETLNLFGEALTEIANGPHMGGHGQLTEQLMRRLSEKGLPLSNLVDRKMMDRSRRTLEAHAREYGISFSDYVPMAMRKRVAFVQRGDFFELYGEHVDAVAQELGIVATGKDERRMCAPPAHSAANCADQLRKAWFVVKLIKARKPRRKGGANV